MPHHISGRRFRSGAPVRRLSLLKGILATQIRDLAGLDSRHLVQIIAEALLRSSPTPR
ncbi:hypothetical protein AB0P05_22345 [Streptomyces flaveolus]|uniref:hypothetical protein n=1 Tax=Streptomyces flaveolus TaxID=67297 RepID=UPI0034293AB7